MHFFEFCIVKITKLLLMQLFQTLQSIFAQFLLLVVSFIHLCQGLVLKTIIGHELIVTLDSILTNEKYLLFEIFIICFCVLQAEIFDCFDPSRLLIWLLTILIHQLIVECITIYNRSFLFKTFDCVQNRCSILDWINLFFMRRFLFLRFLLDSFCKLFVQEVQYIAFHFNKLLQQ